MVSTGKRIKAIAAVTLPASLLVACADEPDMVAYCGTEQGKVIEDCDDGHGGTIPGTFIYYGAGGGTTYSKGQVIPSNSGLSRIPASDSSGRTGIGLPANGSIKSGTSIGGIGKGSPGVSVKSGG